MGFCDLAELLLVEKKPELCVTFWKVESDLKSH